MYYVWNFKVFLVPHSLYFGYSQLLLHHCFLLILNLRHLSQSAYALMNFNSKPLALIIALVFNPSFGQLDLS